MKPDFPAVIQQLVAKIAETAADRHSFKRRLVFIGIIHNDQTLYTGFHVFPQFFYIRPPYISVKGFDVHVIVPLDKFPFPPARGGKIINIEGRNKLITGHTQTSDSQAVGGAVNPLYTFSSKVEDCKDYPAAASHAFSLAEAFPYHPALTICNGSTLFQRNGQRGNQGITHPISLSFPPIINLLLKRSPFHTKIPGRTHITDAHFIASTKLKISVRVRRIEHQHSHAAGFNVIKQFKQEVPSFSY